jgi:capsular exopolysaccharide synthesis family protein
MSESPLPNQGVNPIKETEINPRHEESEGFMDLRYVYYLILSRWWVIILVVGTCMATATGWIMRQPKIYESRAVLLVQQQEKQFVMIDEIVRNDPSAMDFMNTIVQSLHSRNLMLRVIDANKLRENPTFSLPNISSFPTDIQLAEKLKGKLKISLRRGTRLIDITAEDTDPVMARDLAASVVKEFMKENFSQRSSMNRVASEFLQEEAGKLKDKLEDSESRLQRYKEENKAVSLEERQNIIVERLRELSTKVTSAKSERLRLESDIEQINSANPENVDELLRIASVSEIPQVAEHREKLLDAETEFAATQERYGPLHPKYIAATSQIESLKQALRENVEKAGDILNGQYNAAVLTESKLIDALKEQEAAALELNKIAIPFNVLQREVETDSALYQSIIKRMKETTISVAVENNPYVVVEEPMIAANPSKPQKTRTLALVFAMSIFISAGIVIIIEGLDSSFRTVDDAEKSLNLPSLACVPKYKKSSKKNIILSRGKMEGIPTREMQDGEYKIATLTDPSSTIAEAYRTLRASLSMMGVENNKKSLLIVSAIPEEGKTFTAINTAVVLSQQNFKTLLIDADLRRPSIQKALGIKQPMLGLSDILCRNSNIDSAIITSGINNLYVLPAGGRAPNPAELLSSEDFPILMNNLMNKFDRIVIDSAPINAVSDTLIIAPYISKTLLVVCAGKTPRKAIYRAIGLLKKSKAIIGGFVLNKLPTGPLAGYSYYYYGDKYQKDSVYGSKI